MICQYKCKFYLNASHYIKIDGVDGKPHSHCFEFTLDMAVLNEDEFTPFNEIEKIVENYLGKYQNQLINEIEPFDVINPTLEDIAKFFEESFMMELRKNGWVLLTIEVSETPSRSYIINVAEDVVKNFAAK